MMITRMKKRNNKRYLNYLNLQRTSLLANPLGFREKEKEGTDTMIPSSLMDQLLGEGIRSSILLYVDFNLNTTRTPCSSSSKKGESIVAGLICSISYLYTIF